MSTLELIWDRSHTYDGMCSGLSGSAPLNLTARVIHRIQSRVFLAHLGPRGMKATQNIALKMARGVQEVAAIEREVYWYQNELTKLQGTVVPRFLGFFRGRVDRTDIACMLMEYCAGSIPMRHDMEELNRQIMLTSCRLHEAGILHGDLMDGRHLIGMGNGVRIVDFSTAVRHRCLNGTPCLLREGMGQTSSGCPELLQLEAGYGIFSGDIAPRGPGMRRV